MPECGFSFLQRPERVRKPRREGITVALDWGRSLTDTQSFIETVGDIVDHMKLTDHIGLMWRYPQDFIRAKNRLYSEAGIPTLPGGVVFEIAAVQGVVPQFMQRVAALGFGAVEVSADCIDFSASDRAAAIALGVDSGLTVFTELGKKNPDKPLDLNEAVDTAQRDLECGASMVVIEKSDVELVVKNAADTLHRLIERVGRQNVIVECGPGENRFQLARWLITEFGVNVNLENIDAPEVFAFEAMRHGFHRAMDFSYFHAFKGKTIPPISRT
jgi:phosphosulfolactate synthase